MSGALLLTAFGLTLACVFGLVARAVVDTYMEARAMQGWPHTRGVIEHVRAAPPTPYRGFTLDLHYRYCVGDQAYVGHGLDAGDTAGPHEIPTPKKDRLDTIVPRLERTYAVGSEHPVYYDPLRPERSALSRIEPSLRIVLFVLGCCSISLFPVLQGVRLIWRSL